MLDIHSTLISHKQIMIHVENNEIIEALSERARENVLCIFTSGLQPKETPPALVVAQGLGRNNKRYNFAHRFAMENSISPSRTTPIMPNRRQLAFPNSHPIPIGIDRNISIHRHPHLI